MDFMSDIHFHKLSPIVSATALTLRSKHFEDFPLGQQILNGPSSTSKSISLFHKRNRLIYLSPTTYLHNMYMLILNNISRISSWIHPIANSSKQLRQSHTYWSSIYGYVSKHKIKDFYGIAIKSKIFIRSNRHNNFIRAKAFPGQGTKDWVHASL